MTISDTLLAMLQAVERYQSEYPEWKGLEKLECAIQDFIALEDTAPVARGEQLAHLEKVEHAFQDLSAFVKKQYE